MSIKKHEYFKNNIYRIIPIITLCFWALISLIKDDFNIIDGDYPAFYYGGKVILTNPNNLYAQGWVYMPSFALALSILSLIEYGISKWIFFFIILIIGALSIIEFDKILILKKIDNKLNRFLFLLVISNGIYIMNLFDFLQKQLFVLFLILLFIKREIKIRDKNGDISNIKFQFTQLSILIFAIGMSPNLLFLCVIYLFRNVSVKSIFSKHQFKRYSLFIIVFISQNFLFLIFPNLIIDFLQGFYLVMGQKPNIYILTPQFIIEEQIYFSFITLDVIGYIFDIKFPIGIISLILMSIITIVISFQKDLIIEKKFGYFALFSLFFNSYITLTQIVALLPLIALLFIVKIQNLENYWSLSSYRDYIKKNFLFLIGLICIILLNLNPPMHFLYRAIPITILIPLPLLLLISTFINTILVIDLYLLRKKEKNESISIINNNFIT